MVFSLHFSFKQRQTQIPLHHHLPSTSRLHLSRTTKILFFLSKKSYGDNIDVHHQPSTILFQLYEVPTITTLLLKYPHHRCSISHGFIPPHGMSICFHPVTPNSIFGLGYNNNWLLCFLVQLLLLLWFHDYIQHKLKANRCHVSGRDLTCNFLEDAE